MLKAGLVCVTNVTFGQLDILDAFTKGDKIRSVGDGVVFVSSHPVFLLPNYCCPQVVSWCSPPLQNRRMIHIAYLCLCLGSWRGAHQSTHTFTAWRITHSSQFKTHTFTHWLIVLIPSGWFVMGLLSHKVGWRDLTHAALHFEHLSLSLACSRSVSHTQTHMHGS